MLKCQYYLVYHGYKRKTMLCLATESEMNLIAESAHTYAQFPILPTSQFPNLPTYQFPNLPIYQSTNLPTIHPSIGVLIDHLG